MCKETCGKPTFQAIYSLSRSTFSISVSFLTDGLTWKESSHSRKSMNWWWKNPRGHASKEICNSRLVPHFVLTCKTCWLTQIAKFSSHEGITFCCYAKKFLPSSWNHVHNNSWPRILDPKVFEILKYECNCILQLQISRCAETFVALLQSITNRYKGLSDVTLQLQFIQLQVSKNVKPMTYWLHS